MLNMNTVKLYSNDGTLSEQAQFLMFSKPDDMSTTEWRKIFKQFKSQLSEDDLKKFKLLKHNQIAKNWQAKNPEKAKQTAKNWKAKNRKKVNDIALRWRVEHPEKTKKSYAEWKKKNPERAKESYTRWHKINSKKVRKQTYERRKTPKGKLRDAVLRVFSRISKSKPTNTLGLLGCSWEEAKAHIERLWQEGMNWENHGTHGWHIDHIRPVSSFKDDELHLMNRIENLQPLWWQDNIAKSNKF